MQTNNVLSIFEIAKQILSRKEELGSFDTQQSKFRGWELRKNELPYRSYPKAYREAYRFFDVCSVKITPTQDEIIASFAICLLSVFKRDRKIKAERSEEELKTIVIDGFLFSKEGIVMI